MLCLNTASHSCWNDFRLLLLVSQNIIALHRCQGYFFVSLNHTWVVTNGQKFLFFCHSSQTSPSKTSTAEPFSVFSFPYHIPMWTLSIMNRLHSPLSYVWYFAEGYGTSTSARKVSESDPKQNSYIILKMHTVWQSSTFI